MQTFPIETHSPGRPRVSFSPDGRWLGLALTTTPVIDSHDGTPYPHTSKQRVVAVGFVPERNAVFILTAGPLLMFLDLDTGKKLYSNVPNSLRDVAVTADGRMAFVASWVTDLLYHVIPVRLADQQFFVPFATQHDVCRLQLSADGKTLVSFGRSFPLIWRFKSDELPPAELLHIDPGTGGSDIALSHDGAQLALATPRGVRVHETATGKELFRSGLHRMTVTSVAFAPDRPLMATGGVDGKVFFWENGRVVQKFEWGIDHAMSLAFAPDGLRCAACDYKQVVVWDVDE